MADLLQGNTSGTDLGSRLGPAIAPRRRGRPARVHPAGRPLDRQRKPRTEKRKAAPRETRTRLGKRSKLAQEIIADGEVNGDGEPGDKASSAQARAQAQAQAHVAVSKPSAQQVETTTTKPTESSPQAEPSDNQPATGSGDTVQPDVEIDLTQLAEAGTQGDAEAEAGAEGEADTEPEMTTEQIISQLTHDEQDLHDLLRSHAQAEYEAQQQQQGTDGILPSSFTGGVDDSSGIDPPGTIPEPASGSGIGSGSGSASGSGVGVGVGIGSVGGSGHGGDTTGGELSFDESLAQQIRALHEPIVFGAGPRGSCDICQRTQTTVWRKIRLPDRDLHVCNRMSPPSLFLDRSLYRKSNTNTIEFAVADKMVACGMYHIKTGHIRPRELWGDGKMIRKRRKSTHPKGFNKPEPTLERLLKVHTDGSRVTLDQGQDQHQDQNQGQDQEGSMDHGIGEASSSLHQNHQHQHQHQHQQQPQPQPQSLQHDQVTLENQQQGAMTIDNMDGMDNMEQHHLEDVVGHEEFRATLGMDGLGEMIHGFDDHDHADDHDHHTTDVNQDVVNVFGNVE